MGIVGGLLLLPMSGPVFCFRLLLEQLREEAEAIQHDEGRGYAELIDLSMRRNAGKISDAEFAQEEAQLLERLNAMRESRQEALTAACDEEMEQEWLDDEPDAGDEWMLDAEPLEDHEEC